MYLRRSNCSFVGKSFHIPEGLTFTTTLHTYSYTKFGVIIETKVENMKRKKKKWNWWHLCNEWMTANTSTHMRGAKCGSVRAQFSPCSMIYPHITALHVCVNEKVRVCMYWQHIDCTIRQVIATFAHLQIFISVANIAERQQIAFYRHYLGIHICCFCCFCCLWRFSASATQVHNGMWDILVWQINFPSINWMIATFRIVIIDTCVLIHWITLTHIHIHTFWWKRHWNWSACGLG